MRCWEPADAPLLQLAISESLDHLRPWMPWAHAEPEALEEKVERLRGFRGDFDLGNDFVYGIFDRSETKVVGGTGLHTRAGKGAREIGYWIHAGHLRQGYATEAVSALTRVAFDVDEVGRVEIKCDRRNGPSAAIPPKVGFSLEGIHHDGSGGGDGPRETMVWAMSRDRYSRSPARSTPIRVFDAAGRPIL